MIVYRDECARQIAITGYLGILQRSTIQAGGRRARGIMSASQQSSQSVMSTPMTMDNMALCRDILGVIDFSFIFFLKHCIPDAYTLVHYSKE